MNSVQLKDIVFSKNTPIIDCKFTPLFFDIFGGVLVSTGLFDLSAACGGFLVTSLIIRETTLHADYGYAAAA